MIHDIPLIPVLAIVFLASLIRSTFGFGDALIGMPLLALVVSLNTATPLMAFVGPTLAVALLLKEWRQADLKSAGKLIISTLAGIPLGLVFLKSIDERPVYLVLAVVIILFALYNLARPGFLRLATEQTAVIFGFAAGLVLLAKAAAG
jgi:uncharacterized protein